MAPLAWAIGREAARCQGLDLRRGRAVAIASGLLAAVLSPLVLGSVVPDSYTPFTVFVLAAALLTPRVVGVRDGRADAAEPSIPAGLGLGLAMGLAYLSRQEVVWLGLTVVLMLVWALRVRTGGSRLQGSRATPLAGRHRRPRRRRALAAAQLARARQPLPGAGGREHVPRGERGHLRLPRAARRSRLPGQGLATVLWNPSWPRLGQPRSTCWSCRPSRSGLAGLVALVGMRRSPALRRPTALVAVLICSALTFVSTVLLFPVATLWGTFMHSSGPLLVGLGVVAALGGDALLARSLRATPLGEAQRRPRAHRARRRGGAADGLPGGRLRRPVASSRDALRARWRDSSGGRRCGGRARGARHAHHRPPHVAGRGHGAATPSPCPTRSSTPSWS